LAPGPAAAAVGSVLDEPPPRVNKTAAKATSSTAPAIVSGRAHFLGLAAPSAVDALALAFAVGDLAAAPPVHLRHFTPTAVCPRQSTHSADPHTPHDATRSFLRWFAHIAVGVSSMGPPCRPPPTAPLKFAAAPSLV